MYVVSKSKKGPTSEFNIFVLDMGDLSFVAAPYEMFDTNGKEIKDGPPFATTIITTISNGGNGYIPSQLGYDHGGYSVDTGTFAAGTGEQLRDAYLKMLKELHDSTEYLPGRRKILRFFLTYKEKHDIILKKLCKEDFYEKAYFYDSGRGSRAEPGSLRPQQ